MKVAVGLSGGVDSAVAALLLKRAGHDVVGVSMKLWREDSSYKGGERDACFGPGEADDIAAAGALAEKLGIDYRVFDCSEEYERTVLGYFRRERTAGRTPNPCIVCNRFLKFGLLPQMASAALEFDRFATGHYARIVERGGRLAVARAADASKDQSYFLWGLSQQQLARAMFPLGDLTKAEVRRLAHEEGFPMADKADSQDFYSGDANEIVGKEDAEGRVVDLNGKTLGTHRGYWHYTVGQRQGLGIGGGTPFYVVRVDPCRNEVVVGRREEAIGHAFSVEDLNWQGLAPTEEPISGFMKIRSTGRPAGPVTLENGVVRAPDGLFGVAPGQSAVLYSDDGTILCGGIILSSPPSPHESGGRAQSTAG